MICWNCRRIACLNATEKQVLEKKNPVSFHSRDSVLFGGEGGIRTPDTGKPHTRFRVVRLQPLGHLSAGHIAGLCRPRRVVRGSSSRSGRPCQGHRRRFFAGRAPLPVPKADDGIATSIARRKRLAYVGTRMRPRLRMRAGSSERKRNPQWRSSGSFCESWQRSCWPPRWFSRWSTRRDPLPPTNW